MIETLTKIEIWTKNIKCFTVEDSLITYTNNILNLLLNYLRNI